MRERLTVSMLDALSQLNSDAIAYRRKHGAYPYDVTAEVMVDLPAMLAELRARRAADVYAWNNIGRIVTDDGRVECVANGRRKPDADHLATANRRGG